jgi:hypothetical protein
MGKFTMAGRNAMLASHGVDRVGAFDAGTPITGVTGTASTDVFAKTAHGLSNGDLVVLTELTGGAGLQAGDAGNANENAWPYFVITANANDFQLAHTPGGSAVDFTTNVTALTVTELVELSGGAPAYARKTIAYNAPAGGSADDSTNGAVIDVPAGAAVSYLGYWNNASGELRAIDKVTEEVFAAQGTYTVTDSDLDLLAA